MRRARHEWMGGLRAAVATVLALAGCHGGAAAPSSDQAAPPQSKELEPAQLCAKIAAFPDVTSAMPCETVFSGLYMAMRRDNPAYYSCLARCTNESADLAGLRRCEERAACGLRTAPPAARTPGTDERVEGYCRKMTAFDGADLVEPALGMWTCVALASTMKQESERTFDCSYACAMRANAQPAYQQCLQEHACRNGGAATDVQR